MVRSFIGKDVCLINILEWFNSTTDYQRKVNMSKVRQKLVGRDALESAYNLRVNKTKPTPIGSKYILFVRAGTKRK